MLEKAIEHTLSLAEKFPAYLPFFVILSIIAFVLYKANKDSDNKFTVLDFVSDKGYGSLEKLGMLTSQLTITWWFVDLSAQGKADVQDVLVYGGLMGVSKFASTFLSAKYGKENNPKDDKNA